MAEQVLFFLSFSFHLASLSLSLRVLVSRTGLFLFSFFLFLPSLLHLGLVSVLLDARLSTRWAAVTVEVCGQYLSRFIASTHLKHRELNV